MGNLSIKDFITKTVAVACNFCGGAEFSLLHDKMRHGINLKTVICNKCGLCQTNPKPTPDNLAEFYDKFYHLFHGRVGVDEKYLNKSKRHASTRVKLITKYIEKEKTIKVLEIGTGAGQFLKQLSQATKWDLKGIEPGTDSYHFSKEQGLNVENVFVDDYNPTSKFDLVASFHVVEHVPSPKSFFLKANQLLSIGGLLHIEVPNLIRPGIVLARFLQYPHLFNFTFETLLNYGLCAGFQPYFTASQVSNLTIIFRKAENVESFDLNKQCHFAAQDQATKIRNLDKIYRYLDYLPNLPGIMRMKQRLVNNL